MESLSHWDSADEFTGQAAAALVLGIEPNSLGSSGTEQDRLNVVCNRMALDYEKALKRLYHEAFNTYPEDPQEIYSNSAHELKSVKLKNLCTQWIENEEDSPLTDWLLNDNASAFQAQKFSRETLADWLDAIKLKTAYQFRLDISRLNSNRQGHWPWGNHHTENLGHLEAAARRFWTNYDPSDPTTACKNDDVADWLETNRGISKNMAQAIASMLRADGLKTGPRK